MTTKNITFITWIMGKIVELLVFGTLGSQLIETVISCIIFVKKMKKENHAHPPSHRPTR